jgi:anthranilate phosphoribosyltransferase
VAINAGAALTVTGVVKTLAEGAEIAGEAIQSGGAKGKLEEMARFGSDQENESYGLDGDSSASSMAT